MDGVPTLGEQRERPECRQRAEGIRLEVGSAPLKYGSAGNRFSIDFCGIQSYLLALEVEVCYAMHC